jgi:hypothetical protein
MLLVSTGAVALGLAGAAGAQQGQNLGGGVATGTIAFSSPVSLGGSCHATDFTISGTSESVVLNTVITAYAGPVQIAGAGRDSCPSGLSQSGAFQLTATGAGPSGGTLDCGTLAGTYTRLGTVAAVTTSGTCLVNGFPADVMFVAEVAVVPDQLSPMRTATFVAPFTVSP